MSKKIIRIFLMCLFVLFVNSVMAQNAITGTVTDDTGSPLPGASVVVKGTTHGVITDVNGKYNLSVPANARLVVSFVGMTNSEVAVGANKTINIQLKTSTVGVEEVVVTAMGITRAKKSLAYSVSAVKSDDLVKGGNANVLKSLDGKVSGVNLVSLSSDPTSSVLVNIRGTTAMPSVGDGNVSLKGQPLYVIDGIPVGNQGVSAINGVDFGNILSQLSPEDIETVTVLKGGSAGALYGSAGGNGVIMITTKSGKGGKKGLGVSFTTAVTVDSPYMMLEQQQLYGQGGRGDDWAWDTTDQWGPRLDGSRTENFWNVKTQAFETKPMYAANENRLDAYLQNGSTVTSNVNVNGNYEKGSFRFSLGKMENNGVMPNTKTNQWSATMASEYKLNDKIKISANANYTRTHSPNKANVAGGSGILNGLMYNMPSNMQPLSDMKDYWLTGFNGVLENGMIMQPGGVNVKAANPWWVTYERINIFSRNNFFGKLQMDWKFNDQFALLLRSGMDNIQENYEYRQSFGTTNLANRPASGDGAFMVNESNSLSINSDAILTYNKTVNKFDISVSGGVNYAYGTSNGYYVSAGALSVPGLFTIANVFPGRLTANYGWGTGPSISAYGTADIGWDKQVFVGVTGRNDWIGNLKEEKINYFYPSVSLSWVASETFKLPEAFNLVKARLGLANVGNGLVKQRSVDTYTFESPDWSGSVKTANINASLVDPNIKPMTSVTKEIGLDVWMLNKKLAFDFTYFIKDQNNQLGGIPLVQGTGFTNMTTNVGDVRNKGYEWGLTVSPVRTKDWNWDITGNFTHYKATIIRLSEKFAPAGYIFGNYDGKAKVKIAEGEEIGNIYEENPSLKVKEGIYKGQYLLSNKGKIQRSADEKDREQIANFNPDYIIGINTTIRYKSFSLNLVGSLRKGGKYVSVNRQYQDSNGASFESVSSGPDNPRWSGGRDEATGGHAWPAIGASKYASVNAYNDGNHSDLHDAGYAKGVFVNPNLPAGTIPTDADYIVNGADPNNTYYDIPTDAFGDVIWNFTSTRAFDATNFKLREVSLSYNLPKSATSALHVNNVNVSLIGRNVFQWNASGRNEDPESAFSGVGQNQGILRATLPPVRSLGFKLSFDF
ncbi:MAG: SusC/RagA family TonB-linked outer membrane protein [Prolixibacteraceae bacterium]|jgi:TonB-linked SusC/RagA family outer membrane protein|nr:SusC/RagA family TonB-linked outer membrane protein [Prolixibacteraceae bacterium]